MDGQRVAGVYGHAQFPLGLGVLICHPRLRWEHSAQRRLRLWSKFWKHETVRFARVREQNARPPSVRDDAHAWPWRHGLRGQQHGHIEEFLQSIGADHTGLLEQGLDRGIARGEGR